MLAIVAVLLAIALLQPNLGSRILTGTRSVGVPHLQALIARWGSWAPLASVLLMVIHTIVPFPAELLTAANGLLFGLWGGLLVSWIGAMAGACVGFALARTLGRTTLERMVPAKALASLDGLIGSAGWQVALAVRLIPIISFNLINFALGFTCLPWHTFLWTTAIGVLPVEVAVVAAGYGIGHNHQILWWGLSGLALLTAGGLLMRRRLFLPSDPFARR